MAKSERQRKIKKKELVEELKKELKNNEEVFKRNKEGYKIQVQVGLHKKGLPQGMPMYDSLIEKMKLDAKELKIKIDSKFKVVNPTFEYQKSIDWQNLQIEFSTKTLKALFDNIIEIENNVSEVECEIAEQNSRIELRNKDILNQLKEMNIDISDVSVPNYIG